MDSFKQDFKDYVLSGHAMLSIVTHEKDRAIQQMSDVAKEIQREIFTWSIASGWLDTNGKALQEAKPEGFYPEDAIQSLVSELDLGEGILVLKDFGFYLQHETYNKFDVVISWLDTIKQLLSNGGQTIVFLGPAFKTPNILSQDITAVDFDLPDRDEIESQVRFVCENVQTESGEKFAPDQSKIKDIVDTCGGMTHNQVADRTALALRKHKDLNTEAVKTILNEKASIIESSGLLTYIEPPDGGLNNVGGYDALKDHVRLDMPCFSEEAREFGIDFPRGLMLVGIPGCGKTLLSTVIASEFNFPLISLDVGNLMSKWVGDSEANMREAIKIIERIAPCVLQLDEIEKGFGGSGDLDGGSSQRVFGTFLKWLNDRTSPVYVVATANAIQNLPPEFSRAGRFDVIFGLDLPSLNERKSIFMIHMSKRNRYAGGFELDTLAKATDGFTGADIEQVVKLGLKIAYSRKESLFDTHLMEAVESIVPLSKTEPERINAIRKWCETRAKPANPKEINNNSAKNARKITV